MGLKKFQSYFKNKQTNKNKNKTKQNKTQQNKKQKQNKQQNKKPKNTNFVNKWNLEQFREQLIFCQ